MGLSRVIFFQKIFTRDEKKKLIGFNIFNLLVNALDIGFLGLLLWIINFYSKPKPYKISLGHWVLENQSSSLLIFFVLLFILKNFLGFLHLERRNKFFFSIATRISKESLLEYLHQEFSRFIEEDSSIQIRKISQEPIEFITYILMNVQEVITQIITIFFTLAGIAWYNSKLFLGLFLLLLPPLILLNYFSRKKLQHLRKGIKISSEKSLQTLREALDSFIISNIQNKRIFFQNRYLPYQKELNGYLALNQSLQGLPTRFLEVFAVLGYGVLQWILTLYKPTEVNLILETGIFLTASYKIIPGIVKIMNSLSQLKTYSFTIEDLSPKNARKGYTPYSEKKPLQRISFREVNFQFEKKPILVNQSFEIEKGNFLVLTGKSGSGKTTLVNLILGLLSEDKGEIYFNKEKSNAENRKEYWPSMAYVNQDSFIFQDTISKNIILSDEVQDPKSFENLVQIPFMQEFIGQLENGLETQVWENGKNLSGGQKQRIMLARALYRDFDLLILDEAFSELDEGSGLTILNNLKELTKKDKMILFITHNPNYFRFGDKLINLNNQNS